MSLHLSDLDELSQRVLNRHSKEYFKEAVVSYRAGAYRSALIATWISVCIDIIEKIRELSVSGEGAAKVIEGKLDAIDPKDPGAMLNFERQILDFACDELELISVIEKSHLEKLKDDRNICAHPNFSQDGNQFSPPAELALAYMVQAANYLLTQTPVKGKVVVNRLFELINENSFPESDEKAFAVLSSNNYLGRARASSVRNLIIILLKRLFRDDEGLNPDLLDRISAALGAINRINSAVYSEVIRSKLDSLLGQASDKQLKRFFPFLSKRPEAWVNIDEGIKVRIEGLLRNMEVEELINYRLAEVSTASERLNAVFQEVLNGLEVNDQEKIVAAKAFPVTKDRAIEIFIDSKSFASAEHRGVNVLLPHAKYLSTPDLERIFEGALENRNWNINQILNAGSIGDFFAQLYSATKIISYDKPNLWKGFWEKILEKGFEYESLKKELEKDGLIPERAVEEEDDEIPF
ncbi:hypothetical protein [Marinobacter sp. MBR-105]|jgi:hypothetical protein